MCEVCGEEKKLIPAGVSKKTGKPYDSFLSCPNRCKSSPNAFKGARTGYYQRNDTPQVDPIALVMDEIKALNDRIDAMAKYLIEKLEKKTG